jgi:hypothetical protein
MSRYKFKEARILEALLSSPSVAQAARVVGLSERTLFRKLEDPDFQEQLTAARRRTFGVTLNRIASLSGEAVTVLEGLLRNRKVAPAVRARIGLGIIAHACEGMDITELFQRVDGLLRETKDNSTMEADYDDPES